MAKVLTAGYTLSPGFKAKKMRVSLMLTQQELANLAGVSREEVDLFEQNFPVRLEIKNKILKELLGRQRLGEIIFY